MSVTITQAELKRFAPKAKAVYVETLLGNLDILREAGILDSGLRLSHFMAQCGAETGGFVVLRESLAYRPARLRQVWPSRFANKSDAYLADLCSDQVKLADSVYGGRMGNRKGTSDGYDFRGGGFLQTTGRYAVEKYCAQLGETASPGSLDNPVLTLRFACLEWKHSGCNEWADQDDVLRVSKAINTGSATSNIAPVGMEHRLHWLVQAKAIWEHAQNEPEPAADPTADLAERKEAAPEPPTKPGWTQDMSFQKVNELADQGSRLAQMLRRIKTWIWGTAATAGGAVSLIDTKKGSANVFVEIVRDHPFVTIGIAALVLGVGIYFAVKLVERYLLTAVADGRYRPRGGQ